MAAGARKRERRSGGREGCVCSGCTAAAGARAASTLKVSRPNIIILLVIRTEAGLRRGERGQGAQDPQQTHCEGFKVVLK